mmetsp:Transcript_29365/g.94204  ORF Transcript_29365/g.94204 Transcript_29365/m.94204 type:complete len:348 (+) Transcript_29365:1234-2277(+)
MGQDVICQAVSGMGKTAVFVLSTLHQYEPVAGEVSVVVLCHTRELAFQISREYERFSKYLDVKTAVFYGGVPEKTNIQTLKDEQPHIVVGTPGRIKSLVQGKHLKLETLKCFVMDECDRLLEKLDMRAQVQEIFRATPPEKQVMMFSATMSEEIRPVCRRFCQNQFEIFIDDDTKLTLHGLRQYYVRLGENEKNRKLMDLLDTLEFNQVVIFVSKVSRATELDRLLNEVNFPSICITGSMPQTERIKKYKEFKEFKHRLLVSTDLFGRGIDIERVNIVVNYDFPDASDQYLHRVGRAGRFGTKGLAISFVTTDEDSTVLADVQSRFEVEVPELPEQIEPDSYMNASA